MLEAAYTWELGSHRIARAEDETVVRAVRAAMDEATAAQGQGCWVGINGVFICHA